MTDETDTSFWDKKQAPPKRRPKRKMRGVRDLHAEIRALKAALKTPSQQEKHIDEALYGSSRTAIREAMDHNSRMAASLQAAPPREKRDVPADDSMFEGLEPGSCASHCGNGFCVITHDGNCAHPMTSPLQQAYFNNKDVMQRYLRAKKYCAKMRLDKLLEAGLGM